MGCSGGCSGSSFICNWALNAQKTSLTRLWSLLEVQRKSKVVERDTAELQAVLASDDTENCLQNAVQAGVDFNQALFHFEFHKKKQYQAILDLLTQSSACHTRILPCLI